MRSLPARLSHARDLLRAGGSIDRAAAAAGMSRYHFSRTFRAAFGRSPHQVRIDARMDRARELLLATDRSVTDIAFELGCKSLGSFVAQFARRVGEPPGTWRRRAHEPPPACLALLPLAFRTIREDPAAPSGDAAPGRTMCASG